MIYRALLHLVVDRPVLYSLATFTVFAAIYTVILRWVLGAPWEAVVGLTLLLGIGSTTFSGHWITRDL